MIVLDGSAAVSALLNDGPARRHVGAEVIHAPHLIDTEVVSALRRHVAGGHLADADALRALAVWKALGLIRYAATPLLDRVWELGDNVSSYDALYVALAESLGCELVTADSRLAGADGPRCVISVVPR